MQLPTFSKIYWNNHVVFPKNFGVMYTEPEISCMYAESELKS